MATNMTTVLKASAHGLAQPLNPHQFSRRRSDGALFHCAHQAIMKHSNRTKGELNIAQVICYLLITSYAT